MISRRRACVKSLPGELSAILVADDADLCRMARTRRYLTESILPPSSGVWNARFLEKYDPLAADSTSEDVKVEYGVRSIMLAQTPSFQNGEGAKEKLWLNILSTLLVGSYNIRSYQQGDEDTSAPRDCARIKGAIMCCDPL
ncbi:hypothetical protein PAAG_07473 [Paracoccidioides lutzii Pb01]|uniref:Uncharacterized protein n=1 Tax=Paracoccidioides lutzii (strain ATCC MYA-826 / Pb01) TaxID=502779 RepID=C1H9N2_PARBA|nr:hypothetical protein PAAG_07473 [Paracoccidioides lutzii Pb01]EEH37055.2 hypothetical protein PAAG_07473 [Paracoccidioides lutzii Pb01]